MASHALRAVGELWPEALSTMKGLYPACGLIDLGRLLNLVRPHDTFEKLLPRLKSLNQGAHAELIVAGSLIEKGLTIRLGAPCDGKVLDIAIENASGRVFVEITAPLKSKGTVEQERLTLDLATRLNAEAGDFSIAIEFTDDPTLEVIEALLAKLPTDASEEWQAVGDSARFRRWLAAPESRVLSVEYPGIDFRTEKILRMKAEQLAKTAPNILVIDMSAIGGSIAEWLDASRRLLQPTKNRRIGAVVLFRSLYSAHLDRGYRLWWIVENPHAYMPIPKNILEVFRDFDESEKISRRS
jgi:hypothetical protein